MINWLLLTAVNRHSERERDERVKIIIIIIREKKSWKTSAFECAECFEIALRPDLEK